MMQEQDWKELNAPIDGLDSKCAQSLAAAIFVRRSVLAGIGTHNLMAKRSARAIGSLHYLLAMTDRFQHK